MPQLPYTMGIELEGCDGWAVFEGAEGDDPSFCAFFTVEAHAVAFAKMRGDDGELLLCDPAVVLAIQGEDTLVAANDFELDTHEKLRKRWLEYLAQAG